MNKNHDPKTGQFTSNSLHLVGGQMHSGAEVNALIKKHGGIHSIPGGYGGEHIMGGGAKPPPHPNTTKSDRAIRAANERAAQAAHPTPLTLEDKRMGRTPIEAQRHRDTQVGRYTPTQPRAAAAQHGSKPVQPNEHGPGWQRGTGGGSSGGSRYDGNPHHPNSPQHAEYARFAALTPKQQREETEAKHAAASQKDLDAKSRQKDREHASKSKSARWNANRPTK